ncbi:MAG: type IV secretion system protein [Paludibacteraceae bacterium]|nr:type IV secretion system protein [Paludibacteraceae bacterium]
MADFSTQMDFVGEMADFVQKSQSTIQGELLVAVQFATALCGFFALFYIANIVWKSWANGGQIDIYKCLKPFVIGILILNFSLVSGFIDIIASGFSACSRSFQETQISKSNGKQNEFLTLMKTYDAQSLVSEDFKPMEDGEELGSNNGNGKVKKESGWGLSEMVESLSQTISETFSMDHLMDSIMTMGRRFICWLSMLISSLVGVCMIMIAFVNKCILIFFGPMMFALSLLPKSEGMIMGWCKKYFTYSLYPAIINIINGIMCACMSAAQDGIIGSTDPNSILGGTGSELVYTNYALTGISIIAIFLYLAVPSVAGQIMEVGSNMLGTSAAAALTFATSKSMNKLGGTQLGQTVSSGAKMAGVTAATGGLNMAGKAVSYGMDYLRGGKSGGKKEAGDSYKG